ncbi:hypothetical protein [Streptomyces sp. WAC00263]|uniref:hypothetical protein n=1 Tax=Streptomyces sp. WAC00263 TaxID=1917422 RepID=UPI0009D13799|nr:hypothetical protein [Streptomyces sp. WAC00263]KAF5992978.1 hypothetical protein BOG92_015205 [Streptomyces sp. WAC00263]
MTRTSRTQRLVMLAASTALAAGGALIPSSAFAAPATSNTGHVVAVTASHQGRQAAEITGLVKNSTTTTTKTTVKKELTINGLKITTITKTTKITKNSDGIVIKKVVKTTKSVKFIKIGGNNGNNNNE